MIIDLLRLFVVLRSEKDHMLQLVENGEAKQYCKLSLGELVDHLLLLLNLSFDLNSE